MMCKFLKYRNYERENNNTHCAIQDARKAQLENHEPEDEEEDLLKDLQDSG